MTINFYKNNYLIMATLSIMYFMLYVFYNLLNYGNLTYKVKVFLDLIRNLNIHVESKQLSLTGSFFNFLLAFFL